MLSVDDDSSSVLVKDAAKKIRIGMVLDQPFPFNERVEREAIALTEAGFEVHLLCADHPAGQRVLKDEAWRGFYIHRVNPAEVSIEIPFWGKQSRFLYEGAVKNYFNHFKNIDTAWHTLIHRFTKNYGIQILHIHHLRLVDTGLNIAFRYGLPLIADLHENYPALMQAQAGPQDAMRERERWEKIETDAVQRANRVLTASREVQERLLHKGVTEEKTLVLENTVPLEKFAAVTVDQELVRHFRPSFVLTYVGPLHDSRQGIQTVIEAMALLKEEIPELQLIAAGEIREAYYQQLISLIEQAGLQQQVHFTGGMEDAALATFIEAGDVCLYPSLMDEQANTSLPEAVYWYHLLKRPVLASNVVPLRRYVENTGGGLVFEPGNAGMLADLIRMLYRQPELRREMTFRGHQAVMERYNWERTARGLVGMYRQLAAQYVRALS